MKDQKKVLEVAEIPYDTGELHLRYSRYLSPEGDRWIRHGLFQAHHRNGQLASEGLYEHGVETELWKDYHENGQLASGGHYKEGKKDGLWRFWNDYGEIEEEQRFVDGDRVE